MGEWKTVVQEISAFIQADELLPHFPGLNLRVAPSPAPRRALGCSSPLTLGEAVLVSCNFGQVWTSPHSPWPSSPQKPFIPKTHLSRTPPAFLR